MGENQLLRQLLNRGTPRRSRLGGKTSLKPKLAKPPRLDNLSRVTQQGNLNRRNFLKTASAATLGALAAGAPRQILAKPAGERIEPTADAMIVLWMGGGMAHTETFDPKRYTPFEK
ncbi:MAG TPA: twin-arginine translocation signal domain-containing protein, partial [Verrucomicrobiota bacterium]|nr:twin-arginine translocation signal domain-containing protein [Verrucomicrobiota bacterium]